MSKTSIISLIAVCLCLLPGYAGDDRASFAQGVRDAKQGKIDFAFSYFDFIARNYPQSPYYEKALFATGEYYFIIAAYENAEEAFRSCLRSYPQSELKPFVLAYLLRMAKSSGGEQEIKELEKEIVKTRQVSLVFRDFKEYKVTSPLNKQYKVVFYIDKVEVFVDAELFEEVPF